MSFNLLDSVKDYFSTEFVNQAASSWGESNAGVTKSLSAIIPAGLAGIINKATSGPDVADKIFNMAKDAAARLPSSPNYNRLSSTAPANGNILSTFFGGNHSGIVSMIARFAGIKESSASSLMSLGLPVILGIVGKHAEQNHLSPPGLAGFLSTQKDSVRLAVPAGLSSMLPMLGLGAAGSAFSSTAAAKTAGSLRTDEDRNMPPGTKWLMLLILFVAGLAVLWYFMQERKTPAVIATSDTSSISEQDTLTTTSSTSISAAETIMVKLPNGKELGAYKGGIEERLVTFLGGDWKSMSDEALKAKWFDFDNLNFNTGNATLLPESQKQLDNIAEILKAFPDAKIKIGGYTDASGDAAANKRLSQDRADAAREGLKKLGVGPQVISAEGYGAAFAKYPTSASEQERAADRRVSVSVRK